MNVNISENEVIIGQASTIQQNVNINEKINGRKILYEFFKRILDIIGGAVGVTVLIPVTLCVYIARVIKKENDGPLFFEQLRIGKDGKEFRFYKFRTMVMNADEKLEKYLEQNEEARKEYEKYKKLKHDPRITRLGEFLRKTSIDEFPQFINVLKGDMSIVGNRPYLPREKEDMGEYFNDIVKTKCGIVSYWAVNGRNDVTFQNRLEMEKYYSNNRSLILDIKILLKAVKVVVFRKGSK